MAIWDQVQYTPIEEEYMPNWTNEQKQAIYEKDSNLLVAAAARKW